QVTEVRKEEGSFVVKTDTDVFTAQYVVMAVGTQGTQRTLGVPGEDLSHVWPRLDDAEKYTNNDDIVVIGGGDAGIEVATDLVSNNRVRLVVRTPEFVRANSSLKYEALRLAKARQLTIHFGATVARIEPDTVTLKLAASTLRVQAHQIFVMIGSILPR